MYGEIAEVVVFSPNRGSEVVEYCGKYTVGQWRAWRRAQQLSWATSLVLQRLHRHPDGSCAHRGGFCGRYRPPCLSCRSAEGSTDGSLALVKARTPFEGCAHACRGFCS